MLIIPPYKGGEGVGPFDMKKIYLQPALKIESAQVANMLAESLTINGDITVDGSAALTKENSWDIWTDEE